jgi:hypothetical protein
VEALETIDGLTEVTLFQERSQLSFLQLDSLILANSK